MGRLPKLSMLHEWRRALEAAGVEFIEPDEKSGPGVRLTAGKESDRAMERAMMLRDIARLHSRSCGEPLPLPLRSVIPNANCNRAPLLPSIPRVCCGGVYNVASFGSHALC
jgi:hypothetical protein